MDRSSTTNQTTPQETPQGASEQKGAESAQADLATSSFRVCTHCKQRLPIASFPRHGKLADGSPKFASRCKACKSAKEQRRYKKKLAAQKRKKAAAHICEFAPPQILEVESKTQGPNLEELLQEFALDVIFEENE